MLVFFMCGSIHTLCMIHSAIYNSGKLGYTIEYKILLFKGEVLAMIYTVIIVCSVESDLVIFTSLFLVADYQTTDCHVFSQ